MWYVIEDCIIRAVCNTVVLEISSVIIGWELTWKRFCYKVCEEKFNSKEVAGGFRCYPESAEAEINFESSRFSGKP